jgi:AcrR family transcriptional regulator
MTQPTAATTRPRRDADRTREALVTAAGELFNEHGYDRTTVREIGARAGVDPALIARYFDGKPGLYLAVLSRENAEIHPEDLLAPGRMRDLLERVDRRGPGPILRSTVQHSDGAVGDMARETFHVRLVEPMRERFERAGCPDAQLRAEVATAAVAGVLLGRHAGALGALADASADELVRVVDDLLSGLLRP